MDKALDEDSISAIRRHTISFLFLTPPIAAKLAKIDIAPSDVKSVKWLLSPTAPMHDKLPKAISAEFSGTHVTLEWATTETMLIAIQTEDSSKPKVLHTETGEELGPNEEGELLVRSVIIARFAGLQGRRRRRQRGLRPSPRLVPYRGDYGYLDEEDSNVYIIDRLKEMLRVGRRLYGSHVSATEMEAAVSEHPATARVVVAGMRGDSTQMDQPTAFVILKPEYENMAGPGLAIELERFAARKLRGLKRLTAGIHLVAEYPMVGFKVDRKALKTRGFRGRVGVAYS
ncbi:MAG: hypothetical protein Q9228_005947 [Teloschistes exilis]